MVNEWTRDDLPDRYDLQRLKSGIVQPFFFDDILDAVVEHLNANHQKPTPGLLSSAADCVLDAEGRVSAAKSDADRWRRAHAIVESERDQAREERDEARQQVATLVHDIEWHQRRMGEHCDDVDAAERERDEWRARAEAAEARTAPAVTKAEVGKVVREALVLHGVAPERVTDAVWSLVSGADPAVFVVRESDLPEVWRDNKHNLMGEFCRHWWTGDGDWAAHQDSDAREARALIPNYLRKIAGWEATARAIEAEAGRAADPVEELAGQIESAARAAIRQVCVDLADVAPSLDPLTVERAMEVTAASRKVAAHILGQEAKR